MYWQRECLQVVVTQHQKQHQQMTNNKTEGEAPSQTEGETVSIKVGASPAPHAGNIKTSTRCFSSRRY